MDYSAGVEITELQAERGDGQLDVRGGRGQADPLPQHAAQLRVRPASVIVCPALTDSVDTLLSYVGPETDKTSNKTPGLRLGSLPCLEVKDLHAGVDTDTADISDSIVDT